MKSVVRLTAIGFALVAAACSEQKTADAPTGGNASAPATAADGKWLETVAATPEGGFRMGNPDAPVKLVEYASLTCPHCAHFSGEGAEELKAKYIATGQVSWEFRNFLLNPVDTAAALVARCQGATPFFKLTEELFAKQSEWTARYGEIPEAEVNRISTLPEEQRFAALAKAGGLDAFFTSRGIPQAKVEQCLGDKAALEQLVAIRKLGTEQDKITGTPAFIIDGTLAEGAYDWATLEPKLQAALN
jgi:protein-disulfide isomerase